MAQISVMMAAYNTEAYIARALDSILAQTFSDFDVIVVDDGSTDATGAIADAYAAADAVSFEGKYLRRDIGRRALAAMEV